MDFDNCFKRSCIILGILCVGFSKGVFSYKELNLADSKVCNTDFKTSNIKLKNGDESSIVITSGNYFADYTGRTPYSCKFVVKAKDNNDGIYVVIQDLNLRESQKSYEHVSRYRGFEEDDCLDYVEFSIPANDFSKIFGKESKGRERFCGRKYPGMWLDYDYNNGADRDLKSKERAENAYISHSSEVAVEIVLAKDRVDRNNKLVISLAFTSFKKGCFENSKKDQVYCRVGECIYSQFLGDGIQHCPYKTCADENGCQDFPKNGEPYIPVWKTVSSKDSGSELGNKITFGAVGAIILVLLKFGLCLWLCKRLRRRRARQQVPARQIPFANDVPVPQPSAPPLPEIETKDLPPSYESLYPDGQRQETQT